jgi:hypothetical protein
MVTTEPLLRRHERDRLSVRLARRQRVGTERRGQHAATQKHATCKQILWRVARFGNSRPPSINCAQLAPPLLWFMKRLALNSHPSTQSSRVHDVCPCSTVREMKSNKTRRLQRSGSARCRRRPPARRRRCRRHHHLPFNFRTHAVQFQNAQLAEARPRSAGDVPAQPGGIACTAWIAAVLSLAEQVLRQALATASDAAAAHTYEHAPCATHAGKGHAAATAGYVVLIIHCALCPLCLRRHGRRAA